MQKIKGKVPELITLPLVMIGLVLAIILKNVSVWLALADLAVVLAWFWLSHLYYVEINDSGMAMRYGLIKLSIKGGYSVQTRTIMGGYSLVTYVGDNGKKIYFFADDTEEQDTSSEKIEDTTDYEKLFKTLEKPSIAFEFTDKQTNSHIGGLPMVEKGFTWPTAFIGKCYGNSDDNTTNYMELLADIDLAEVKPFDTDNLLPKSGHLCVFYDMEGFPWDSEQSNEGVKVFYFENPTEKLDAPTPKDTEVRQVYPIHNITFSNKMSVPTEEEFNANTGKNYKGYFEAYDNFGYLPDECAYTAKMFGYADFMQGYAKPKGDYVLLMQLDSYYFDDKDKLDLGDAGFLFIYITKQDLINKDFSKIKYVLQCG